MDDLAFGDDDEIEPEHYRLFDQALATSMSQRNLGTNASDIPLPTTTFSKSSSLGNQSTSSLLQGGVRPPPPPPPSSVSPISEASHRSELYKNVGFPPGCDDLTGPPKPTSAAGSISGIETYRSVPSPYTPDRTNGTTPSSLHSSPAVTKLPPSASSPYASSSTAAAAAVPPPTENQRQSSFYLSLLVHAELEAQGRAPQATTTAAAVAPSSTPGKYPAALTNSQSTSSLPIQSTTSNDSIDSFISSNGHGKQRAYHESFGAEHPRSSFLDRKPSARKTDMREDQERRHSGDASLYPTSSSATKNINFSGAVGDPSSTAVPPTEKMGRQSSFYRSLLESAKAENAPQTSGSSLQEAIPPPTENTRQSSFYLSLLATAAAEEKSAAASQQAALPGNNNKTDKVTDVFIEQMKRAHITSPGQDENLVAADSAGNAAVSEGGEVIPPPPDGVLRQSSFYLSLFAPPSDTTNSPQTEKTSFETSSTMLTAESSLTAEEVMAIAAATEKAEAEAAAKAASMGACGAGKATDAIPPMVRDGENGSNIDVRLVGQTIDAKQYDEQIAILARIQEEREAEQRTLQRLQQEREEEETRKNNLLQVGTKHQENKAEAVGRTSHRDKPSKQEPAAGQSSTTSLTMNTELLMKGNRETWDAIAAGEAHVVTCLGCRGRMQVAKSASLVFCPICRTVSPATTSLSRGTSYAEDDGQVDASVSDALQRQEYLAILRARGADISNTVACRELDNSVMDKVNRKLQEYNNNNSTNRATNMTVERKLDMYSNNRRNDDKEADQKVRQKLNMYRENRDTNRKVEEKLHHYAEQKRKNNQG